MSSRQIDPNRGRAGRNNLKLEQLEDRCCPSAVANSIVVQGHSLQITTGNKTDLVTIRDNGNGTVTASTSGADGAVSLTGKSINQIQVTTGSGSDKIDYATTSNLIASESLNFNLGSGSNQLKMDLSHGVSAPKLAITLNSLVSKLGGDQVTTSFGTINNTSLNYQASLGGGGDHFYTLFGGDLQGNAAVNLNVAVGKGFEGIYIQTEANIAANASLKINEFGGPDPDTLHSDYSGKVLGQLSIVQHAGGNGDLIGSDVTLASGSTGTFTDNEFGGSGADLFVLRVHDNSGHLCLCTASIMGTNGDDMGIVTTNVKVNNVDVTYT